MVSIIVCTYNRDKYIYQCLSRLARNTCPTEWELVVVDNNSVDQTQAECERFAHDYPQVKYRYLLETQQGLSYARNRGIQEAQGDWFVFLDDDAMVGEDYLGQLHELLAAYPQAAAFGGPITPFFEQGEPKWLSRWSMGFVSAINMGPQVKPFKPGVFPIGANMGIARTALEQVGLFNPTLGRIGNNLLSGEEKDMFNRIRQHGGEILYFPTIGVEHCIPTKRTTTDFIRKLGRGVGISERQRTLSISRSKYTKRIVLEMFKWVATLLLSAYYTLLGKRSKGTILIVFRWQVSKGLFYGK